MSSTPGSPQRQKFECPVCGEDAKLDFPCISCGAMYYCSARHRATHMRLGHGEDCERLKQQLHDAEVRSQHVWPHPIEPLTKLAALCTTGAAVPRASIVRHGGSCDAGTGAPPCTLRCQRTHALACAAPSARTSAHTCTCMRCKETLPAQATHPYHTPHCAGASTGVPAAAAAALPRRPSVAACMPTAPNK